MTITEAKGRTRAPSALQEAGRHRQIQLRKLLVEAIGIHKVAGGSRSQTALHTQWLCDSLGQDASDQIDLAFWTCGGIAA